MSERPESLDLVLEPEDNERLRNVCGQLDEHLRQVERRLDAIRSSEDDTDERPSGEEAPDG